MVINVVEINLPGPGEPDIEEAHDGADIHPDHRAH